MLVLCVDCCRHGDDARHPGLLELVSGGLWCGVDWRLRVHAVREQHIQRWRLNVLLSVSRRYARVVDDLLKRRSGEALLVANLGVLSTLSNVWCL